MSDFYNPERTLISDTECYPNFWSIGFRRVSDGKVLRFEHSSRVQFDRERVRKILMQNLIIGYNWQGYDQFMVAHAVQDRASNTKLKKLNDQIIVGTKIQTPDGFFMKKLKYWEVEDALGIRCPRDFKFIDLMEPQPNPKASLKQLMARMHAPWLQDLPYSPDTELTSAEMDMVLDYMGNDLLGTHMLFDKLQEALQLRHIFGQKYKLDLMSKSDSQCGEAIFKKRVEAKTGEKIKKIDTPPGTVSTFEPPEYINLEPGTEFESVFRRVCESEFVLGADRKINQPKWLEDYKLTLGKSTYSIGIGGLHSTEANRAVFADENYALLDFDVGSYYPNTIIGSGLYPKALGPEFVPIYGELTAERLHNKRLATDTSLPWHVISMAKTTADGVKIFVNGGGFGKLGSPFSPMFAPKLLIAVTLTGQWALLMFIQWCEAAGIEVVSANTDGVVLKVPRAMMGEIVKDRVVGGPLAALVERWEEQTGFKLEATEYVALLNASVNEYIAIKPNGKAKRKGKLSNPWKEDVTTQLKKNPNAGVCSDAVVDHIVNETPIEQYITNCKEVRDFVCAEQVDGGAIWTGDGSYLGKVVRYYWGKGGAEIVRKKTGGKVPKTDGARPLMVMTDELPADIDYDRYIEEAKNILINIGFYWRPPEFKKIQTNKDSRKLILASYLDAMREAA